MGAFRQNLQVTKGRLTRIITGEYREFSLNPNDLSFTVGYNYPDTGIPGGSHPVTQAGGGKAAPIRFTLRLDADIGYRHRRRFSGNQPNSRSLRGERTQEDGSQWGELSVQDEMNWYLSMVVPGGNNARLGDPDSVPYVLLFTFGSLFRGTRVVVTDIGVKVLQLTPELKPMRADLAMNLKVAPTVSIRRADVYNPDDPRRNF